MPELPPRARRIHGFTPIREREFGTTSACAENTVFGNHFDVMLGNYLRVRGEYTQGILRNFLLKELPPRARRILGRGRGEY